jgi:hypothetical protein
LFGGLGRNLEIEKLKIVKDPLFGGLETKTIFRLL